MALFGHGSGLVTELPTLAVLMAHFGHYIANFDGVPSELPPGGSSDGIFFYRRRTADLGSSGSAQC